MEIKIKRAFCPTQPDLNVTVKLLNALCASLPGIGAKFLRLIYNILKVKSQLKASCIQDIVYKT